MNKENVGSVSLSNQTNKTDTNAMAVKLNLSNVSAPVIDLKTLVHECEKAATVLEKKNAHWEDRADALARLKDVAIKGGTQYTEFVDFLVRLKDPLNAQIKDLRSSIMKETSVTLSAIAAAFQENAIQSGNYRLPPGYTMLVLTFVETLLAQTCVTIKVISESADQCIQNIVTKMAPQGLSKLFSKFCGRFTDKSNIIRLKCVEYITIALVNWNNLHKEAAWTKDNRRQMEMAHLLSRAIVDADEPVRRAARVLYWTFHECFPEGAKEFLKTVDETNRRRVLDAKVSVQLAEELRTPRTALEKETTISSKSGSENSSDMDGDHASDTESPETSTTSTAVVVEQPTAVMEAFEEVESLTSKVKAMRIQKPEESGAKRIAGPQRIAVAQPAAPATRTLGGAVRVGQSKATEETEPEEVAGKRPTHESRKVNHITPGADMSTDAPPANDVRSVSVDALIDILANSSIWSERADAISKIMKVYTDSSKSFPANTEVRLVPVLCERACDLHFKVLQHVLKAINAFLPVYSKEFGDHMRVLLPSLFNGLSDSKATVAKLCNDALNLCMTQYPADFLCPILSSIVRQRGDKLRLGCVEMFEQLVPRTTSFFSNATHILQLFKRLEGCLTALNPKLRAATVKLLVAVSRLDEVLFNNTLESNELSQHMKDILYSAMGTKPQRGASRGSPSDETDLSPESSTAVTPVATEISTGQRTPAPVSRAPVQEDSPAKPVPHSPSQSIHTLSVRIEQPNDRDQVDMFISHVLGKLAMGSTPLKLVCFREIQVLLNDNVNVDWNRWCSQLITASMNQSDSESPEIRKVAFDFVGKLAKHQPKLFSNSVEFVLQKHIEAFQKHKLESQDLSTMAKYGPDLAHSVRMSMHSIVDHVNAIKCLTMLLQLVGSEQGVVLCESLRLLDRVLIRIPSNVLFDCLQSFVPLLIQPFSDPDPAIRRAVMLVFVRLHNILGESLVPYMSQLTGPQQKLVTIYINRTQNASK